MCGLDQGLTCLWQRYDYLGGLEVLLQPGALLAAPLRVCHQSQPAEEVPEEPVVPAVSHRGWLLARVMSPSGRDCVARALSGHGAWRGKVPNPHQAASSVLPASRQHQIVVLGSPPQTSTANLSNRVSNPFIFLAFATCCAASCII